MISFTYFALKNITISKVNVDHDEGEHDGEALGQVRSVMVSMCFLSEFSNETQSSQTVVYNFICFIFCEFLATK